MDSLSFLRERHSGRPQGGLALLTSVESLPEPQQHDLGNGLTIRRATTEEAQDFRRAIAILYPNSFRNPFEVTVVPASTPGAYDYVHLPEASWRYHVIQYLGTGQSLQSLLQASCLGSAELETGFSIMHLGDGYGYGSSGALQRLLDPSSMSDPFVALDAGQIQELPMLAQRLAAHDNGVIGLTDAVNEYMQLREIAPRLPLRYLGYFAIIESLITHAPKPSDPYESITRQVTTKFALLNRRASCAIAYERFFKQGSPDTIWKKLYAYRSAIAHGSRPDFEGELRVLESARNALAFLQRATMLVLRHVLDEPNLVADLRNC